MNRAGGSSAIDEFPYYNTGQLIGIKREAIGAVGTEKPNIVLIWAFAITERFQDSYCNGSYLWRYGHTLKGMAIRDWKQWSKGPSIDVLSARALVSARRPTSESDSGRLQAATRPYADILYTSLTILLRRIYSLARYKDMATIMVLASNRLYLCSAAGAFCVLDRNRCA